MSADSSRRNPSLLTVRSRGHDLFEFDRIYTLPDHARRDGGARILSSLVLVNGTVDRKAERKYMIIHGKLEVPIGSLVFQSGRVRDFGLGGTWLCARWHFLKWVWRRNSSTIWGLCFDF